MKELLKKICISESATLKETLSALNEGHLRIALVVDSKQKLLGVVTDGDVRRALINGATLDSLVLTVMKKNPITIFEGATSAEILNLMKSKGVYEIPIISPDNTVIDVKTIGQIIKDQEEVTAVIMAGGKGTRLHPITEQIPKPLIVVGDKPILFTLLDRLLSVNINKIFVAVNYKAEMVKEAVRNVPEYANTVRFIEEQELLGTAGALSLLPEISNTLLVLNADLLTKVDFQSMVRYHRSESNAVTVAVREERVQVPFGVMSIENTRVLGIQEKPTHSYFVSAGMYMIEPKCLEHLNKMQAIDMPDFINKLCGQNFQIGAFPVFEYWKDIGERKTLQEAMFDIVEEYKPYKSD